MSKRKHQPDYTAIFDRNILAHVVVGRLERSLDAVENEHDVKELLGVEAKRELKKARRTITKLHRDALKELFRIQAELEKQRISQRDDDWM